MPACSPQLVGSELGTLPPPTPLSPSWMGGNITSSHCTITARGCSLHEKAEKMSGGSHGHRERLMESEGHA